MKTIKTPQIFNHLRGSTNGVCAKGSDNIWFVAHLVNFENGKRSYYHVVIIYDPDNEKFKYTVPFKFEGCDIEFALGLVVCDRDIVISYSTNDSASKLSIITKFDIASMMV